ncbi:peptide chain release factor N(5)-glutamine methyltransferase [Aquabacterium sp.]|uniref:peptide chain release factor N(5)-glutamine methyltransferase n=1 Tax=Aquabacterium sp. TaxID=1872578 RepID=UPI002D03D0BC|nr:peptide chain release factor N(5)-glutamine methyltransferase [Aquabacterium sp.]HSW06115.1 peptide chain release factor N(5)-glutamine methyltransferase [Aquabacterium sp.]
MTVADALALARALGLDRLDAQVLLGHHLQQPRSWLVAHDDAPVPADMAEAFEADCLRCADEVPLAYLTGEQAFHGLLLKVTPQVLVPRPDTEALVDWALSCLATANLPAPEVLDLGTGSGAIALAVADRWPTARVTATDLSPEALAVAQSNAARLGLRLETTAGDWWSAVPNRRYDLAMSNPPYIAGSDPHLPALRHEPTLALTPGGDGLDAIRQIVAGAPQALRPGAWLLIEHGWDQAAAVRALLCVAGLTEVQTRTDLAQRPRCSGGRWPTLIG